MECGIWVHTCWFFEGEQFNWETRLHILNTSLNRKMERHASSYHWPSAITGLACTILIFLKINYYEINYEIVVEIIFTILLTISFFICIKRK